MPREPSRYQFSSGLSYDQHTPDFLRRLQNRVSGGGDEQEEDDDFDEWQASSGRPPIPRRPTPSERPAIPERPADEPGSADEDDDDEKPQVVVLKEGKHMTAREAENEKRKARGLPPIPDPPNGLPEAVDGDEKNHQKSKGKKSDSQNLSFSSSGPGGSKSQSKKRKVIVGDGDEEDDLAKTAKPAVKKKSKKVDSKSKGLLSFGDDG